MLLEAETNKYCPGGYDFGAISKLITWVLNFFLSAGHVRPGIRIEMTLVMQVLMSWQLADALLLPCRCYSAYILVQFMCVHVCSWNTLVSHVASILHCLRAHM